MIETTWKIGKFGFILLATILVITNPGSKNYEQYAGRELNIYLKQDVCSQVTKKLQSSCRTLVDIAHPQLESAIAFQTQRQNFLLFSVYQTNLSLPSICPDYQFATLGILDQFYTYQAEQQ